MNRREFIRSGAASAGAAVTLSGCGGHEEKLIPLLVSEERILPGVDRWTPSTCAICPAGCGILVRSMLGEATVRHDGREFRQMVAQVKKIEGNPAHPINQGRLCARGQSGPQVLYNPDRIQTPLKLAGARGSAQYTPISWDEALALLESKLKPLLSSGSESMITAISGTGSPARQDLLREFMAGAGSVRCYVEEPLGWRVLKEANRRVFARPELEVHDIENARYVLSFGANFVDTHTSPVRYGRGLGHFRQGRPGQRGKFVQVESRFSLTAANADEWLPSRPGTEASVALAMAHVLLREELYDKEFVRSSTKGFELFRSWVLENYAPEKIAEVAGVSARDITRIAREFAGHQPGFALAGGAATAHSHGIFTAAAAHSLNALAGSVGRRGGISWSPSSRKREAPGAAGKSWVEEFVSTASSIQLLILWQSDLLHHTPVATGLENALARIPFVVAFSTFMDDSSAQADLILPDQTFLEHWDVVKPELTSGLRTLSIAQPVVRPLYEARDRADVLLALARRLGGRVQQALPYADFREFLKRRLNEEGVLKHGSFAADDLDGFWTRLLDAGVWTEEPAAGPVPSADLTFFKDLQPPDPRARDAAQYPFSLQPFESTALGTGIGANLPWMQELPDPMTSVVWGSWVEINPRTAAELGIEDSDVVSVESASGKTNVPALLSPAARPGVVSMPFGQGHRFYGRYAAGRGANPWKILSPGLVQGTGEPAWAATRVRISKTGEKASMVRIGHDREHSADELHR
jgi:anaerobic selenocysteine-containing dehydrogenase